MAVLFELGWLTQALLLLLVVGLGTALVCWNSVCEALRRAAEAGIRKKLKGEVGVSVGSIRVGWKHLEVCSLKVENPSGVQWEAPHCVCLGRLCVRTSSPLGLLGLPGLVKVGPIGVGSVVRDVDTIEVEGAELWVEEHADGQKNTACFERLQAEDKAKSRAKKARLAAELKAFRKRWDPRGGDEEGASKKRDDNDDEDGHDEDGHDEDDEDEDEAGGWHDLLDHATAEPPHQGEATASPEGEGGAGQGKMHSRAKVLLTSGLNKMRELYKQRVADRGGGSAGKRFKDATTWKLGCLSLKDVSVTVKGHKLVNVGATGWQLRAFYGTEAQLMKKVVTGVLAASANQAGNEIKHRVQERKTEIRDALQAHRNAHKERVGQRIQDFKALVSGQGKEKLASVFGFKAAAREETGAQPSATPES